MFDTRGTCLPDFIVLLPGTNSKDPIVGVVGCSHTCVSWVSLLAQMVKNLPAMQETWVRSLAWEDPLEKGKATRYSILAWRVPWTEEPGGPWSMGSQRVRHD